MKPSLRTIFILALVGISLMTALTSIHAQSGDDLQEEIEERSERIEELESEIDEYQTELQDTQKEKATLQEAVSSLNTSINRISQKVNGTENSITNTQARIASLEASINQLEEDMNRSRAVIAKTVKALQRSSNQTLVETLLASDSLAQAWQHVDQLQQIQREIRKQLRDLEDDKATLEAQQTEAQKRKYELADLQETYVDQQAIVQDQKQEKAELLSATNQQASEYQRLIQQKQAQKEAFEAELRQFEEQLQSSGTESVPEGNSQFSWPVTPVRITQQFGGTEFAKRNPGAYGRPFHNGTDFGVPVGTNVKSVSSGTVRATGNTDRISGCYSYGKWVLVDHNNGLSTLYAHLSRISTQPGAVVAQGEKIGYSGNTGYSTGPHLHLTTYIKQDVQVVPLGQIKQRTNCASARIPVAPLESYLNSMDYLPGL